MLVADKPVSFVSRLFGEYSAGLKELLCFHFGKCLEIVNVLFIISVKSAFQT